MSPSVVTRFGQVVTKVAKPIMVQLAQGATTLINEVVLGAILDAARRNSQKNFMVYALDGIEAILGNTFLDTYRVNVLGKGSKLRVIIRLANRYVSLEVEYQTSLAKVGIHLISLQ
jgi:hypothetical protein